MAEYCLECYKKLIRDADIDNDTVFLEIDLCECCGEIKPCVVGVKKKLFWRILKNETKKNYQKQKK